MKRAKGFLSLLAIGSGNSSPAMTAMTKRKEMARKVVKQIRKKGMMKEMLKKAKKTQRTQVRKTLRPILKIDQMIKNKN